jgi:hypothetical protein
MITRNDVLVNGFLQPFFSFLIFLSPSRNLNPTRRDSMRFGADRSIFAFLFFEEFFGFRFFGSARINELTPLRPQGIFAVSPARARRAVSPAGRRSRRGGAGLPVAWRCFSVRPFSVCPRQAAPRPAGRFFWFAIRAGKQAGTIPNNQHFLHNMYNNMKKCYKLVIFLDINTKKCYCIRVNTKQC